MLRQRDRRLGLEQLEERSLLTTVMLDNGLVGVLGTKTDDVIEITRVNNSIVVIDNGSHHSFHVSSVNKVAVLCQGGHDSVTVNDNVTIPVWIDGGKGNDTIKGGSGDDVVSAGAGNDTILGSAGVDWLFGDAGHDVIECGDGDDVAGGGKGNDIIHGGNGNDVLSGEAGRDQVYGELGDDACHGATGNDHLDGGEGDDQLMGATGADSVVGGVGDDLVDGGSGKDDCRGGDGDDRLKGGAGSDQLDGEAGANLLDKDKGKDVAINGLVVDLDVEFRVPISHQTGATATASYELFNDNGTIQARFTASVYHSAFSTYDIVVDGVAVGQITTDHTGKGELVLSSSPSGNELPFPTAFPTIHKGSVVSIGFDLHGQFVEPFLREPRLPPLPTL